MFRILLTVGISLISLVVKADIFVSLEKSTSHHFKVGPLQYLNIRLIGLAKKNEYSCSLEGIEFESVRSVTGATQDMLTVGKAKESFHISTQSKTLCEHEQLELILHNTSRKKTKDSTLTCLVNQETVENHVDHVPKPALPKSILKKSDSEPTVEDRSPVSIKNFTVSTPPLQRPIEEDVRKKRKSVSFDVSKPPPRGLKPAAEIATLLSFNPDVVAREADESKNLQAAKERYDDIIGRIDKIMEMPDESVNQATKAKLAEKKAAIAVQLNLIECELLIDGCDLGDTVVRLVDSDEDTGGSETVLSAIDELTRALDGSLRGVPYAKKAPPNGGKPLPTVPVSVRSRSKTTVESVSTLHSAQLNDGRRHTTVITRQDSHEDLKDASPAKQPEAAGMRTPPGLVSPSTEKGSKKSKSARSSSASKKKDKKERRHSSGGFKLGKKIKSLGSMFRRSSSKDKKNEPGKPIAMTANVISGPKTSHRATPEELHAMLAASAAKMGVMLPPSPQAAPSSNTQQLTRQRSQTTTGIVTPKSTGDEDKEEDPMPGKQRSKTGSRVSPRMGSQGISSTVTDLTDESSGEVIGSLVSPQAVSDEYSDDHEIHSDAHHVSKPSMVKVLHVEDLSETDDDEQSTDMSGTLAQTTVYESSGGFDSIERRVDEVGKRIQQTDQLQDAMKHKHLLKDLHHQAQSLNGQQKLRIVETISFLEATLQDRVEKQLVRSYVQQELGELSRQKKRVWLGPISISPRPLGPMLSMEQERPSVKMPDARSKARIQLQSYVTEKLAELDNLEQCFTLKTGDLEQRIVFLREELNMAKSKYGPALN